MGLLAIMTNCALLSLSTSLREKGSFLTEKQWTIIFIVIEHILIGITFGLQSVIPNVPYSVKIALARMNYESRQALKHEVIIMSS